MGGHCCCVGGPCCSVCPPLGSMVAPMCATCPLVPEFPLPLPPPRPTLPGSKYGDCARNSPLASSFFLMLHLGFAWPTYPQYLQNSVEVCVAPPPWPPLFPPLCPPRCPPLKDVDRALICAWSVCREQAWSGAGAMAASFAFLALAPCS